MGLFDNRQQNTDGAQFERGGKTVTCSHCGGVLFVEGQAQLNTAGMSFLGLDWLNKAATVFTCAECGHLEWFVG